MAIAINMTRLDGAYHLSGSAYAADAEEDHVL